MLASGLLVAGWGYFLIQGVRDPLGGVNSLWPLFGIANQMLAAIGLCLGTTVILKMALRTVTSDECGVTRGAPSHASPVTRHASLALITLVPLVWLLAATMTAGVEKIFHPDPRIGFLAEAARLNAGLPALEDAVTVAKAGGVAGAIAAAEKARNTNRVLHFNNVLDAVVAAAFLVLVTGIVAISVREWVLLLARRKLAVLRETQPAWLPDYAVAESKPLRVAGILALTLALGKELSGEAHMERVQEAARQCRCWEAGQEPAVGQVAPGDRKARQALYLRVTEKRHRGITQCC